MVEVLYHIADIHIPNNISRHEEYKEVFEEVYKKLKEEGKEKLIVICGDLFHDKTMIKPEALSLAKDFIFNLCMYSEVIIIDGNHDINITNDSRMSTIEAMINHIKSNNKIHYLKENKVYKINGINFGLTTMYSDEVTKIENKNKEERYICLYHGTLYKSKTYNDYEFLDEKILKSKDFKDYDITLLGDIHKYQYLNKKKTIAYASSLIQQNFGEEEVNHGMLRWDVKTLGSEFIEIKNNYVYKTINIEDASNYEIEGIENKRTRLRIRYNSIDREKIRKYESQIKKRYNIISITSEENYEVLKDIKEIEEDILNKKMMDVYYEFIKKKDIKEDIKVTNKIKEYVEQEQKYEKKIKKIIKIKQLEFENLFSYGEKNKINFEKMEGINILIGKNGLGKSSIIDIILFTLFNKFSRGEGKEALNIKYNNGKSILKIELNGIEYTIKRIINGTKIDVKLYEGEKDITEDGKIRTDQQIIELFGSYEDMIMTSIILQVGNNFLDLDDKEKQNILINIFGLNIYDNIYSKSTTEFRSLSTTTLKNLEKQLTDKDYKQLLININEDIDLYTENIKSINEEIQNIYNEELLIKTELKNNKCENLNEKINEKLILKRELDKNERILEKNYSKYMNKNINEIQNNINKMKNENENIMLKINDISKKIIPLDMNINNLRTLKKEKKILIKKYDDEIEENKKSISNLEKEKEVPINILGIDDKEVYSVDIQKELIRLKNINESINDNKTNNILLNMLEEKNMHLLTHRFNDKCKNCNINKKIHESMGHIEEINNLKKKIADCKINEDESKILEKKIGNLLEIKSIINEIDILNNKIDNINDKKSIEELKLDKIENNINSIFENIKYNEEINKLQIKYDENKILCKEKNDYILIQETINKLNEKYNILVDLIDRNNIFKKDINRLNEIIDEKKEINERYESHKIIYDKLILEKIILNKEHEKQIEIIDEYNKYYEIRSILKYILNLYESGFKEFVISKKILVLENKMNNILKNISDYEIKIETYQKNIKFYKIINDNKFLNVRELCGYERISFNIAFRLALNSMNAITKNNFIIIDEGFSAADDSNIHKITYLLDVIKKEYDICIIISHIEEIKNQEGRIIKITSNNETNCSYINII